MLFKLPRYMPMNGVGRWSCMARR